MSASDPTKPTHDAVDSHRRSIDRIDKTISALLAERQRHGRALATTRDVVAYQGAPGAFSEAAAMGLFGSPVRLEPCRTLEDVFDLIARGEARYGVVPIENSLAGAVPGCADLLARHDVHITGERIELIAHALIAPKGVPMTDVRRVLSHPVAIAQCEQFFRAHPEMTAVPAFDTAGAVAEVLSRGWTDAAAIASHRAAALHDASVLADDIQDRADNSTRFLAIEAGPWSGTWEVNHKTTLLCVLPHEPGALVKALLPFSRLSLNLCRIESRPTRETPFEYGFHLDIGGTQDISALATAIGELEQYSRRTRVLGHYAS
jgi:prephenate dehydratase